MAYRYETHCHCAEGSACAGISVEELVRLYHAHGFSGICLTDHFTGNSALPDDLSWAERVERHFAICAAGRREGEKLGLKVFFGIEHSLVRSPGQLRRVTGNDFVILGLDKEWWLANEGVLELPPRECFNRIHAGGGFIIHAHPFLEAEWVDCIRLLPRHVDAVEVLNGHTPSEMNQRAAYYAWTYGLRETAGSDTHADDGFRLCGVETDAPCHTVEELIAAIRAGTARAFREEAN